MLHVISHCTRQHTSPHRYSPEGYGNWAIIRYGSDRIVLFVVPKNTYSTVWCIKGMYNIPSCFGHGEWFKNLHSVILLYMVYMLELLRAEFHISMTLIILQRQEAATESGTVFWAQETHFLPVLVHLSPKGGQVVSALFLGLRVDVHFTCPPTLPPLFWKSTGAWSVLAKTHTSHRTSAIIKRAILYTSAAMFQGPDKRFVYVCVSLNSLC